MKYQRTRMSGAAAMAAAMQAAGIDTVYGTVGHGNLAFVDALIDTDLRFVSVYHEQVAAHAADAYFRLSGRLAVVTTTVGPGFTNLATGLGDALLDSSAFVVIAGGVPSRYVGKEPLQELSGHRDDAQDEIFRPLTKRVLRVRSAADLPDVFRRAARMALAGNPGPVIVHVPLDYFSASVEVISEIGSDDAKSQPKPVAVHHPGPDPESIRAAADVLEEAERPLIYAGGGALLARAEDAMLELVDRFQVPVATTMSGQGIVPESHPLAVGMTGVVGTKPANRAAAETDCLVAVGTRFPEMDTSSWRAEFFTAIPPSSLIHVDVDAGQIDKIYKATVGVVSDAKKALEALLDELDRRDSKLARSDWQKRLADAKCDWNAELAPIRSSDAFPLEPAALLVELRELLPPEAVLVSGVGIRHAVGQHFPILRPRSHVVGSGFGTMGQEVPAIIGARHARADVPVVGLVGDGALMACLAAWPTAVTAGTSAVWIVLDNGGYASISVYQSKHFGRYLGTKFVDTKGESVRFDYVGLARSFGLSARTVASREELATTIAAALAEPGPSVVVVPVTSSPRVIASGHWDVNDILAATANHA